MHELSGAREDFVDAVDDVRVHVDINSEAFQVDLGIEPAHTSVELVDDVVHAGDDILIILLQTHNIKVVTVQLFKLILDVRHDILDPPLLKRDCIVHCFELSLLVVFEEVLKVVHMRVELFEKQIFVLLGLLLDV